MQVAKSDSNTDVGARLYCHSGLVTAVKVLAVETAGAPFRRNRG